MKWFTTVITLLCFLIHQTYAVQEKARSIHLGDNDIGEIKTALGYSTILQFDSSPTSVVLGDQDAFKVEYVSDGLTIKPLIPGVKTNLFVFTNYERYNFRLSATSSTQADYLVKVTHLPTHGISNPKPSPLKVVTIGKTVICDPVTLTLEKMMVSSSKNYLILTFKLHHTKMSAAKSYTFSPGDIELIQLKKMIPIETLYLDGLSFSRVKPIVRGTFTVKKSEIKSKKLALLGFSASFMKSPECLRASFVPIN